MEEVEKKNVRRDNNRFLKMSEQSSGGDKILEVCWSPDMADLWYFPELSFHFHFFASFVYYWKWKSSHYRQSWFSFWQELWTKELTWWPVEKLNFEASTHFFFSQPSRLFLLFFFLQPSGLFFQSSLLSHQLWLIEPETVHFKILV